MREFQMLRARQRRKTPIAYRAEHEIRLIANTDDPRTVLRAPGDPDRAFKQPVPVPLHVRKVHFAGKILRAA